MTKKYYNPDQLDLFEEMINREILPLDVVQIATEEKVPVSFALGKVLASVTKQIHNISPEFPFFDQ